ncbi:MAG: zinc ribbon domain-containing protein [Ruminococcaceae bacterium]|nr:zinc ribbon domain-containing protein [Oscillospiraceae bacterium]
MNCNKCGKPVGENATFCESCGALCGNNLFVYSRAKYFDSPLCSKKSKTLTTVGWVLVAAVAVCLLGVLFMSMQAVPPALDALSKCESVGEVIRTMESLSGAPLGLTEEDLMMFNADVSELIETIGLIFVITIVVSSVMALAVIWLSIFTVYKKSFKCSVWAAILCAFSVSNLLVFGMSIGLTFIANAWNKEYKEYCANPRMAEGNSNFNFS